MLVILPAFAGAGPVASVQSLNIENRVANPLRRYFLSGDDAEYFGIELTAAPGERSIRR